MLEPLPSAIPLFRDLHSSPSYKWGRRISDALIRHHLASATLIRQLMLMVGWGDECTRDLDN